MTKIAILLPDLRPGGAERMRVHMAGHWLDSGLSVTFVLLKCQGELLDALPAGASVRELGAGRMRDALWPLVAYLREGRCDAMVAAMWPLTVIAPLAAKIAGFAGRVVVSEHAPQSLSHARRGWLHRCLMSTTMRLGYRLAAARVAVSSAVADDMARLSGIDRDRIAVIHNPAATGRELVRGQGGLHTPPGGGPLILSVGTLKPVKRHDVLIRAFSRLPARNARLCILGEGQERSRLEALVAELGLADRVFMPGFQHDPAPWFANADVFVLSSDYEGFGNVIVEALEQGTPVVSTDCPGGPREILAGGKYGALVPVGDDEAMAVAITKVLNEPVDRGVLRRRASEFGIQRSADAYLSLLGVGMHGVI